jgi:PEP-CTERM motif-containing protein
MLASTKTKPTAPSQGDSAIASGRIRSRLESISIRLIYAAGAAIPLLAARSASAQTSLTYLVVPPSGSLPGAGNDGPGVYSLPGYGNVEVTMSNPSPSPLGATYFDQLNAYNETTNNAVENANYGSFTWGTDTQRFDIYNGVPSNETYQFNFTFLSGAPNPADLYFVVDGLAVGTTATVSQAGNLVGEYQFPYDAGYYPAGPSSTTLYGVAGPQTFSSAGDGDPLNTGWALWQPTSSILSGTGTGGGGTLSFDVNQIPGDGIGFTVGYTTVPEPTSLALLCVGTIGVLSRRRRAIAKASVG